MAELVDAFYHDGTYGYQQYYGIYQRHKNGAFLESVGEVTVAVDFCHAECQHGKQQRKYVAQAVSGIG